MTIYKASLNLISLLRKAKAIGGKYLKRWQVSNPKTGKMKWVYKYKPVSQRGAHEVTGKTFEKKTGLGKEEHKNAVEKALQNGNRVSLHILRDYPDLVQKYGMSKRLERADKINAKVREIREKNKQNQVKPEDKPAGNQSMEQRTEHIEGDYGKGISVSKVIYGGKPHYKIKSPYIPDLVSRIQEIKSMYYSIPRKDRESMGDLTFNRNNKAWYIPLDYADKISEIMKSYPQENISNEPSFSTEKYRIGQIIDTPSGKKTVVKVNSRYISEDGLSFNLPEDKGYLYQPVLRDSTPEDLAKDLDFKNKTEQIATKDKQKESLRQNVSSAVKSLYDAMTDKTTPDKMDFPKGSEVNIGFRGDILILGNDGKVYHAVYNGRDGDDWSYNNSGSYIVSYSENPDAVDKMKSVISENNKYISLLKAEESEKKKLSEDYMNKKEQNKIKLNRGHAEYDPYTDTHTVSFPYNQNDVDAVKKISGARYNKESKTWTVQNDELSRKKLQEIFRLPAKEISNSQKSKQSYRYAMNF